jgi:hypothetical protein
MSSFALYNPHHGEDKVRENKLGGICTKQDEVKNAHKTFSSVSQGKGKFGRFRSIAA